MTTFYRFVQRVFVAFGVLGGLAVVPTAYAANEHVVLQTSKGAIELELYADKAPVTRRELSEIRRRGLLRRRDLSPRHRRIS